MRKSEKVKKNRRAVAARERPDQAEVGLRLDLEPKTRTRPAGLGRCARCGGQVVGRISFPGDPPERRCVHLMLALARKIVSGEEDEDATVESVFAKTHHAEAAAEELLVVDIWPVVEAEAEPTVAELRRNECRGAPYRKNCAARLRRIKLRQFPATGAGLPGPAPR